MTVPSWRALSFGKLLVGEKQKVWVLILRHIPNGSEFIAVYQIYAALALF
jgi:hypothetical protein